MDNIVMPDYSDFVLSKKTGKSNKIIERGKKALQKRANMQERIAKMYITPSPAGGIVSDYKVRQFDPCNIQISRTSTYHMYSRNRNDIKILERIHLEARKIFNP